MIEKIAVEQIFGIPNCLDVRSPSEFAHAHIMGARNVPLFSDEERKIVGITYKTHGRRAAIERGFELIQFPRILQELRTLPSPLAIYCARGGMRSASMAWLLDLLGFQVFLVAGGYKSFRRWVLARFSETYSLAVLGGETGSGKTRLLKSLSSEFATIDLEGLACHRGSVFGGFDGQPSQEQFENCLACQLFQYRNRQIWLEDESRKIGEIKIPAPFFEQMRNSPAVIMHMPRETRLQACLDEYLPLGKERLSSAILRLQKRLGGAETKQALDFLEQNPRECCEILLGYYDKKYAAGIALRDPKKVTHISIGAPDENALRESLLIIS